MRIVYFTHSLLSCWNHGNAHFLRGVLRELAARGHDVRAFEPANGWSRAQSRWPSMEPGRSADFATSVPGTAIVRPTAGTSIRDRPLMARRW